MIDYMSFSIDQLQAVDEVLDYITDMLDTDFEAAIVYREYSIANKALHLAITQQALDHEAAEAKKVACDPPAEEPDDLQALVDTLSRCSDQLVALALAEDKRFTESGQTDTFIKLTVLRNANKSIIDMIADIRDHYYFELKAPTASDDTAPPDMFGWVGDALDDLCAAGEATGND